MHRSQLLARLQRFSSFYGCPAAALQARQVLSQARSLALIPPDMPLGLRQGLQNQLSIHRPILAVLKQSKLTRLWPGQYPLQAAHYSYEF